MYLGCAARPARPAPDTATSHADARNLSRSSCPVHHGGTDREGHDRQRRQHFAGTTVRAGPFVTGGADQRPEPPGRHEAAHGPEARRRPGRRTEHGRAEGNLPPTWLSAFGRCATGAGAAGRILLGSWRTRGARVVDTRCRVLDTPVPGASFGVSNTPTTRVPHSGTSCRTFPHLPRC